MDRPHPPGRAGEQQDDRRPAGTPPRSYGPAVRVIRNDESGGLQPKSGVLHPSKARRVRPIRLTRLDDVPEIVRCLRTDEIILLDLGNLDSAAQRRAIDLATGIACALDATMTRVDTPSLVFRLDPSDTPAHRQGDPETDDSSLGDSGVDSLASVDEQLALCALCDLRPATGRFVSHVDTVVLRDGTRRWAPPVLVCERCKAGVRHWRFAAAWCVECQRWGRRGVASPCGQRYGS